MKVYSSHDLIGQEISLKKISLSSIISRIFSSVPTNIDMTLDIPTTIFLRTKMICEHLSNEFEVNVTVSDFIWILYKNFLSETSKKYDPFQLYSFLSQSLKSNSMKIVDYQSNRTYVYDDSLRKHKTQYICSITKSAALEGEIILSEIDEIYNHNATLEALIELLWINFIEDFKKGNMKKTMIALTKMVKQNFNN